MGSSFESAVCHKGALYDSFRLNFVDVGGNECSLSVALTRGESLEQTLADLRNFLDVIEKHSQKVGDNHGMQE